MEKFFKLKENKTTVSTEVMAGVTTFFAMSYILFVNPTILSAAGMPFQAVFLATIIASVIGTLIMGLFAMCLTRKHLEWALMHSSPLPSFWFGVYVAASISDGFHLRLDQHFITVTRIRKMIIHAIPESMQHAIGGGSGSLWLM